MRVTPKVGWKRLLKRHGMLTLAFYIAVCGGLYAFQDRFVYPGAFSEPRQGFDFTGLEDVLKPVRVPVGGGELFALHAAPTKPGNPTVIFFHGNAAYPEDYTDLYSGLLRRGFGILAPAMRGYPRSFGEPGEAAMHSDARALFDWARRKHPKSLIVSAGQSLGTGIAIPLANERDVAAVVLVSPYLSMRSLAWRRLPFVPVPLLLDSHLRSDLAIPKVDLPILAFHGERDRLIPISSARELVGLAKPGATLVAVPDGGHNDGMFLDDTVDRIGEFVASFER